MTGKLNDYLGKGVEISSDDKKSKASSTSGQRIYGLDFDDWTSRSKTKNVGFPVFKHGVSVYSCYKPAALELRK